MNQFEGPNNGKMTADNIVSFDKQFFYYSPEDSSDSQQMEVQTYRLMTSNVHCTLTAFFLQQHRICLHASSIK